MAKTEEYLQEFVLGIKSVLEDKLVSAVLYGSVARGEAFTSHSNVNVLVILSDFNLQNISSVRKVLARGYKQARIVPIFWTEDEIKNATDVFPVEFMEMKENHKILYGADLLNHLPIDGANLRHQIEFELRGKLLHLRNEWAGFSDSPKSQVSLLVRSGTSFNVLFGQAQKITNGKLEASLADPFRRCVLLKKGDIKLDAEEMVQLYRDVHDAAKKIIQIIDKV